MSSSRPVRTLPSCALAGLALLGSGAGLLVAQEQQQQAVVQLGGVIDPNSLAGKESTEGVYVRDSAIALEKFALAQKMERLKEWNKSADLYQEVIDKYPDRVVPSRTNEDDKIVQYTSVTRGVMERLAKWPREGLDVYRARFEPAAAAMIDQAGGLSRGNVDVAELHKVFYRYFVTDTARSVGQRLVDVNLERGEFQAAARLADELLTLHPNLGDARPTLLYRAALAHRLAGDEAKAKERLTTLQKSHADAKGLVRGKEVKLAESLATELQALATAASGGATDAASAAAAADSWTTLGGDATRGRVTPAAGRPGARLFAVPLARPQWRNIPPQIRGGLETSLASQANSGALNGVFPVVDRGELFFQDGTRIYARSLESGDPLPGWLQTYPAPEERAGQYVLPNTLGSPRTHQLTLTLTDRAVLGVMGQPDRNLLQVQPAGADPRLVCLDRRTGKENWVADLGSIELPKDLPDDQQKAVRGLKMNGSPLVVGDSVMVMARGVKQAQFEDSWVVCFHLATGKYRWSCYLASASNVGAPWGAQPVSPETTSHLAYANGRVYALSNLGALAAVDAYSGTIAWLSIYERGVSQFDPFINNGGNPGGPGGGQAPRPWLYNPVIVKDGKVFILPTEGRFIYAYDANTGAEVKRINRTSWGKIGNVEMLLAVMGDRMVVAGERVIGFFDWRKYDPENPDASLEGISGEFDGLRGRPFVTTDSIFVTDARKLHRLSFKQGAKVEEYYPSPWDKTWDPQEEGPGNVLVTSDHVVIAGATHVYGFTDLNLAKARLDREVAAAPQEAGPRLRYARVLFTAGDAAGTIAKIDEAVALLGGRASMRQGADRDWVFNDAISFAQKLAGDRTEEPTPDNAPGEAEAPRKPPQQLVKLIDDLYDRAAAAAASPQQQVHYRLTRARYSAAKEDLAAAAKLYQQVLGDAALRPVPLVDEKTGGPTQASAVAEAQIKSLVVRGGVKVYAPFEAEAAKLLADAQAAKPAKPEALLEIAEAFPNSVTAPKALLAAATAYESLKQPQAAVQMLRQAYFEYGEAVDKPRVIEAMAREYLALPNRVDVAAARIAQGVALPGDHKLAEPLRLPDGTEIAKDTPFPKALEELRKYSTRMASKDLPDFKLPPVPTLEQYQALRGVLDRNPRWPFPEPGAEPVIAGVDALAAPLREFARPDRVVFWSANGTKLQIHKPGGGASAIGVSATALTDAPKGSAWVPGAAADGVLVWSNTAIALVPDGGGDPTWRVETKGLPAIEVVKPRPNAGGDDPATVAQRMMERRQAEQMANFRRNGFVLRNGQFQPVPAPAGAMANVPPRPEAGAAETIIDVRPVGDRVLVTTTTGRVLCVELSGKNAGRIAWQTRLSDRPADRLVANDDFTVVKVSDETSVRLVCLDTVSGRIHGTKSFALNNGDFPVNLALSADGTLVYTLPTRMVLKDLYKPWEAGEKEAPAGAMVPSDAVNPMPFRNASGPDQLVISEGRILALADMGSAQVNDRNGLGGMKYVRVHSLETGLPITLRATKEDGGGMTDLMLSAQDDSTAKLDRSASWDIRLRCVGSRLYVQHPRGVLCYDLDAPDAFWHTVVEDDSGTGTGVANLRNVIFGKNHALLVTQLDAAPPIPGAAPAPGNRKTRYQINACARYPKAAGSTEESGKTDYIPAITEQSPITGWQGVDGGLYYLTKDGKLHFLTAAK